MKLIVLLILSSVMPLACRPAPQSDLPTARVVIGGNPYTLEIAAEPVARQIGLMRRDTMPDDHGMIFLFPDEQPRSFWMKETRIPLDILFLDAQGQVVSIGQMEPHIGRATSGQPAKYAIELNAGAAQQAGIAPGDRIDLPRAIREIVVTE